MNLRSIIEQGDLESLHRFCSTQADQLDENIIWGPDDKNSSHPLHFLCDCVFEEKISESKAFDMAEILLSAGSSINGALIQGKDTPIIAACSLYTDRLGLLYLEHNPILNHHGVVNATCLHWAAWTGSDVMTKALIAHGMDLEDQYNDYKSTVLGWAINGAQNDNLRNQRNQLACIKLLINAGANKTGIEVDKEKWPEIAAILA